MSRFLLIFVLALLGLSFAYKLDAVSRTVVTPWNYVLAEGSFALMEPFDEDARLTGNVLSSTETSFAVSVEDDCNGIEATLILVSAVLAFPAGALAKIGGVVLGVMSIQLLNLFRIVSLYYLGLWDREIFDWVHHYAWPAVILLVALLFFAGWQRYVSPRPATTPAEGPSE